MYRKVKKYNFYKKQNMVANFCILHTVLTKKKKI